MGLPRQGRHPLRKMFLYLLMLSIGHSLVFVEAKPYVILDSMKNCEPKPPTFYNWTKITNHPNEAFKVNGEVVVTEDIEIVEKAHIDLSTCEDRPHRVAKCTYFNTLKLGKRGVSACPIMFGSNFLWTPFISAFHEIKGCPVKTGVYQFANATFDMTRMLPLTIGTWKASIALFSPTSKPSVPAICVDVNFKMRYTSIKM